MTSKAPANFRAKRERKRFLLLVKTKLELMTQNFTIQNILVNKRLTRHII